MRIRDMRVIGNGLRTDHPVPGLPFVDDGHIPIENAAGVEAIGRRHTPDNSTWGRTDPMRVREGEDYLNTGWKAFTTDPQRNDLAWIVRFHPTFGRSVWLVLDEEASGLYSVLEDDALLYRAGGYWLGHSGGWYRPAQIFDNASERYVSRAVPGSATITAADVLQGKAQAGLALSVHGVDPTNTTPLTRREWERQLEIWAGNRPDDGLELDKCVIDLTAPELSAGQLLNVGEVAEIAGINAGTLRSYISRGENEVPAPQAMVGASAVWSRPVIDQWVEARTYTSDAAEHAVHVRAPFSTDDFDAIDMPRGRADVWEKVHYWLLSDLTSSPELRPGILRRWRDRRSAQVMAKELSLSVALGLDQIIPMEPLAQTISDAILGEIAVQAIEDKDFARRSGKDPDVHHYTLLPWTARMLDWLIRHDPAQARHALTRTIRYVEDHPERYSVTTRQSLLLMVRTGLALDGANGERFDGAAGLTDDQVDAFLATVVPDDNPIAQ